MRGWEFARAEVPALNCYRSSLELQISGKWLERRLLGERASAQHPPTLRAACAHQLFQAYVRPSQPSIVQPLSLLNLNLSSYTWRANCCAALPKWREMSVSKYEWRSHWPTSSHQFCSWQRRAAFPATANPAYCSGAGKRKALCLRLPPTPAWDSKSKDVLEFWALLSSIYGITFPPSILEADTEKRCSSLK